MRSRFLPQTAALAIALTGLFVAPGNCRAKNPKVSGKRFQFFERRIRPLLVNHCYACHSAKAKKLEANLWLDTRAGLLKGGDSGPAVVPGKPDESRLITAVRYKDADLKMPPRGKLAVREIADLEAWVRMGVPDPRTGDGKATRTLEASGSLTKQWWSFQPVTSPPVPRVRNANWPRNPVDCFVLARLEAAKMHPAPQADRRTLIRRVTFDLTGLPPTPEEIEAFLHDNSPNAYEKLVDRLLSSSQYGETLGRHWLDVVRYADTSGCNGDFPLPDAWRYRNYVIRSFNADKPYDRFLQEQLAGDRLPAASDAQRFEQVVATGYLPISRRFSSVAEEFYLTLDDTIDNFGKAFLGLSISCARCHSHKFDPIPQADYYALYGIFKSTRYAFPGTEIYRHTNGFVPLVSKDRAKALRPLLERIDRLDAEMFRVYSKQEKLDTGREKNQLKARFRNLQKQRDQLIKTMPKFPKAYAATEGKPANAHIHLKGDPTKPGREVPRGFLTVLGGQKVPANSGTSGRLLLANWVTDPHNPLTARVMVNRIWQHHFGRGLVGTPDDFGARGEKPSHPGLLDWLAAEFVGEGGKRNAECGRGWSIKKLHRLIVLSQTYRSACVENAEYALRDPENKLLWTFNRRRLTAEEIRDAILAVSGGLDPSMGGPHPFPPEWTWRYTQHKPFLADYPTNRRSVYLMQQRIRQQAYLGTFDGADTNAVTGRRRISTTPQQALFLLNDEFAHEQATRFAERLEREATSPARRVDRAFRLVFARPPTSAETREAVQYLKRLHSALAEAGVPRSQRHRKALASYLRVLLSSNEFVFVE
jgi:Protein of unknown function (DUF1553)/Protein of unknown function (DUF1549)/Planctomycete cytochrome C